MHTRLKAQKTGNKILLAVVISVVTFLDGCKFFKARGNVFKLPHTHTHSLDNMNESGYKDKEHIHDQPNYVTNN